MIEAVATIQNEINCSGTIESEISAVAEIVFSIIQYDNNMKWTDTFTHADDALILVAGQPKKRLIEEIPADTPIDQMLVLLDNTPLDCTNPDANVRDVISFIGNTMTFRNKPLNFSLRILYPL